MQSPTSAFFLFMKLENKIETPCDNMLSSAPDKWGGLKIENKNKNGNKKMQ